MIVFYAEAASSSAERPQQDGASKDRLHSVPTHGLWRLVDHLHVGQEYGSFDIQGGDDGVRQFLRAAQEGH